MAVRLWVLGFTSRTAWGFAMAEGADWRGQLPASYRGRLEDALLESEVIGRRLWDVVQASDLYREVVEEIRLEAAGQSRP